ncbi:protein MAIN-LIKE 1-like [Vicia villosa]|uniref:protein MAIN-LIKE 1-like n=1 Tax=Vicia villosa TaxID=3911 RepID=UPI00273AA901|nr:protein MAIN-LIKE 1-like [Vicia villosa]
MAPSQPQTTPEADPQSSQVPDRAHEAAPERAPAAPQAFGGGPSDLSHFPLYPDHVARHIWDGRLKDLTQCRYILVNWDMINAFVERSQHETSFHLSHGDMTMTLIYIACLLHVSIRGTFLDHERIDKYEALYMLVERMEVTLESAMGEIDKSRGSYIMYSYLTQVFMDEIRRAREDDGDLEQVTIHRMFSMRAFLLYLIGTPIFVDTSVTYIDIMYL